MSKIKTNAMRILDAKKINYNMMTYDSQDGQIDGISVAQKTGKDPKMVYKTLVAQGGTKSYYVFVIPVEAELDLKKAAKVAGEKKIEMIAVKDIQQITGYIRGGCSPVGMKKLYSTYIDASALELGLITVSGGKIGIQIELLVEDLERVTEAKLENVIK